MSKAKAKTWWKLGEFVAHGSAVNCLSLSPSNGRMLATGGDDRRINLWVIGKPNAIMSISGITSPVQSVTFNNTENWIGAGSKSGVIKVFDLDVNKAIRAISGHKAAICSVDFHRYGDILASGSLDTNLKLWDVRRKGCIFTYKGHTESINSIQFSPDGKWIISASSDSSIKLWDLSAGRLLADFKHHEGPVTSVQFHPRDYLLASGSSDRTTKIWDLETFQLLSESLPESNSIRCVLFHPEGTALFSGSQDSLKVHGWEPVELHDHLSLRWGKVADMAVYDDQLIGAAFAQTNVSLWCVNMKTLRPFSGESAPVQPSPAVSPLSSSGRRHFEYERQEVSSQHPHTSAPGEVKGAGQAHCSPSSSSEEVRNEAGDSPPTELKDEERREIFASRQKLMRTPPKHQNVPFLPPPGEESTPIPPRYGNQQSDAPLPSSKPSELNRVQVLHVHSKASERDSRRPPSDDKVTINVASRLPPQQPDLVLGQIHERRGREDDVYRQISQQQPRKAPDRGMIDEFMPPDRPSEHKRAGGGGLQADNRVAIREIVTNHSDVCQIFKSRLAVLKDIRAEWSVSEPKAALEVAINSSNNAALVDLLNILHLKRTLWTLEMSLLVLPELQSLISSRHASHVKCGCKVLKLILKSFGPVIKTNLATPPAHGGIDIMKEERYERCLTGHSHLTSLRSEATKLIRDTPTSSAGKVIREQNLLSAFAILD